MVERNPRKKPFIERITTGDYQVPIQGYSDISNDPEETQKMTRDRRIVVAGAGAEITGRAMAVAGLETSRWPIFVAGTTLAIAGSFTQMNRKNRIGGRWSLLMQEKIDSLGSYKRPVDAALLANGVSSAELASIGELPLQTYMTEFHASRLTQIRNGLMPEVMAAVMAGNGDYVPAAMLALAGLAYFPIGNKIHERDTQRSAKVRAGRSSRYRDYIKNTFQEHFRNTDIAVGTSHIPEVVAASLIASGEAAGNIATLYAFTRLGFGDIMAEQRNRDAS
jgi:hypothetical protein